MDLKKGNQRPDIGNYVYLLFKYNKITGNLCLKLNAKINVSLYLFLFVYAKT